MQHASPYVVIGRPRESYPRLPLDHNDERRLAVALSFEQSTEHEALGERLTTAWLNTYKVRFPRDWARMLRNTRHPQGADVAGRRGTLNGRRRVYVVLSPRTMRDKTYRDVRLAA
jgi:hypothetical protein